jgi:hypothetical protein
VAHCFASRLMAERIRNLVWRIRLYFHLRRDDVRGDTSELLVYPDSVEDEDLFEIEGGGSRGSLD